MLNEIEKTHEAFNMEHFANNGMMSLEQFDGYSELQRQQAAREQAEEDPDRPQSKMDVEDIIPENPPQPPEKQE